MFKPIAISTIKHGNIRFGKVAVPVALFSDQEVFLMVDELWDALPELGVVPHKVFPEGDMAPKMVTVQEAASRLRFGADQPVPVIKKFLLAVADWADRENNQGRDFDLALSETTVLVAEELIRVSMDGDLAVRLNQFWLVRALNNVGFPSHRVFPLLEENAPTATIDLAEVEDKIREAGKAGPIERLASQVAWVICRDAPTEALGCIFRELLNSER